MASSGGFARRGRMPKSSRYLRRVHDIMMLIAPESCLSIFFFSASPHMKKTRIIISIWLGETFPP
jgi:hypothetical protein